MRSGLIPLVIVFVPSIMSCDQSTESSIEKRIEYDLYYIRHWSMLFDIRIMVLTLLRVSKNAY